MLPIVLFHLLAVGLSIAGWRRHRASGFLFLLAGFSLGLVTDLIFISFKLNPGRSPGDVENLLGLAHALNYTYYIFVIAGLVCLVYYTRILPRKPGE